MFIFRLTPSPSPRGEGSKKESEFLFFGTYCLMFLLHEFKKFKVLSCPPLTIDRRLWAFFIFKLRD
jgi:hypothetical protein